MIHQTSSGDKDPRRETGECGGPDGRDRADDHPCEHEKKKREVARIEAGETLPGGELADDSGQRPCKSKEEKMREERVVFAGMVAVHDTARQDSSREDCTAGE